MRTAIQLVNLADLIAVTTRAYRQCRGVVSVSSRPTMPGSPLRSRTSARA